MDDNIKVANEAGTIKISADVVTVIASLAASDVKGVYGMSGGFTDDIAEKFGMKSSNKGVKVQVGDVESTIDLFLVVDYGVRIPEVAYEVQQNVKKAVETMTGLKVVEVNIHIQGINIAKNTKENEDAPKDKK